jgi:drug/metabolite transporter (DMT)-like permease
MAMPAIYCVTSLASACLAIVLPLDRLNATMAATLASFALFAFLTVGAFIVRGVTRLWIGLIGSSAILAGILLISTHLGIRA